MIWVLIVVATILYPDGHTFELKYRVKGSDCHIEMRRAEVQLGETLSVGRLISVMCYRVEDA